MVIVYGVSSPLCPKAVLLALIVTQTTPTDTEPIVTTNQPGGGPVIEREISVTNANDQKFYYKELAPDEVCLKPVNEEDPPLCPPPAPEGIKCTPPETWSNMAKECRIFTWWLVMKPELERNKLFSFGNDSELNFFVIFWGIPF
jgi:hypothetical protein